MTEEEAVAYFLIGCKRLDINLVDAGGIMNEMRRAFGEMTPQEAVQQGFEWYQKKWDGPKKIGGIGK